MEIVFAYLRLKFPNDVLDSGSEWTAWERESKHRHAGPLAWAIKAAAHEARAGE